MSVTNHFIQRYFERVLKSECPNCKENAKSAVVTDMMARFTRNQKNAYDLIIGYGNKQVFIPLGSQYKICFKDNYAITVY